MKSINAAVLLSAFSIAAAESPIFRNPVQIPVGLPRVNFLLAADLNGDGHPDVLARQAGFFTYSTVVLSNGMGSFAAPLAGPVTGPARPVAGDVDGDGKLDLALASNGSAKIAFGNGDGTFTEGPSYPSVPTAGAVALGDFNGDTFFRPRRRRLRRRCAHE